LISEGGDFLLDLYDVLGRRVITIFESEVGVGKYRVRLEGGICKVVYIFMFCQRISFQVLIR